VAALFSNTTGANNTASGSGALFLNTTASGNTATGYATLYENSTGASNTAIGFQALLNSTTASNNTATGANALAANTTGASNTAAGAHALQNSTTGANNTALGTGALAANTIGSNNIGVGKNAGQSLTIGSNNIDIGNVGVAPESNKIRIGTQGTQTATFIAGISNTMVSGNAVVVNSSGQLGIVMSSARYKHDIRDMGGASSKLLKLRPVSFRYNHDPSNTLQYGLVAEEVARNYPELVSYGEDGKPQTVRYLELDAMLLNELQKQDRQLQKVSAKVAEEQASNAMLRGELQQQAAQNQRLSAQMAQLKGMFEQAMAAHSGAPTAPRNFDGVSRKDSLFTR
jgi:trimeric autotransporter adhesin